jgi:hypothetical protein
MHFQLSPLFVAMAIATGFTIPTNQPDGVYEVSYDASGHAAHVFIAEAVAVSQAQNLETRNDGVECGGYSLNGGNTDSAVDALKRQCDPRGTIGKGLDFYSISGTTVAYVCNFGNGAIPCFRGDITKSYESITNACGRYQAGWRTLNNSTHWYSTGYEHTGAFFCGRGA